MNRKITYTPEDFNCVTELDTGRYARCGVVNANKLSARGSTISSNNLVNRGTWHNGQSIRIGRGYVQNDQTFNQRTDFVTSENSMWFDIDIDKSYLVQFGITNMYAEIKGNIGTDYIAELIWFPVNAYKQPGDSHFEIGGTAPANPYYGQVWIQTVSNIDLTPSYAKSYNGVDWDTVADYSTDSSIQVNNIPNTFISANDTCKFIVRATWQMRYDHTSIPREVALFVYPEGETITPLCKSPVIKFYNKPNTTMPIGALDPSYFDPTNVITQVAITSEEIVMEVEAGSCADIPGFNFQNTMTLEVTNTVKIDYGATSNAWIIAPDNLPRWMNGTGNVTIAQPGTYTILGPGETLPNTPEIIAWLSSQGYPPYAEVSNLPGTIQDPKFTGTLGLVDISSWGSIFTGANIGEQMFKSVTGDFDVPPNQFMLSLKQTFQDCAQFTDANLNMDSWLVNAVSDMTDTFNGCSVFNGQIGSWNVTQAVNMDRMFKNCTLFNQPLPWYTDRAQTMSYMFQGATNFNQNIAIWDTADVTTMTGMFKDASNFDQNISNWNVINIPVQPQDFDTNTPATWTLYEKPWWGSAGAPAGPFVVLDILTTDVVVRCRNATNFKVFDANKSLVRTVNYTYQGYRLDIPLEQGLNIIFGQVGGVSIMGLNNTDTVDELNFRKGTTLKNGYRINFDNPFQQDNIDRTDMAEQPRIDNFLYQDSTDFEAYASSTFVTTIGLQYGVPSINNWGGNNQFLENMPQIFSNFWNGAFAGMGSLPSDLPGNLTFRDSDQAFTRCFESCWNLPGKSVTDTWSIPNRTNFDLTAFCRWSSDCTGADHLLKRLIAQADTVDLTGAFVNTNITALDFSSNTDTTTKVTSFEGAYAHCNTDTLTGHLTDLDMTDLTTIKGMFAFANGTVGNNFVESWRPDTQSLTDMSYTFANCDVVPSNMTTVGNIWNVTNVINMTSAFMFSKFPDTINDWDLAKVGNYQNIYSVNAYPNNKPYMRNTGTWGLFLGATGNPTSMTGWDLHGPTEFRYDPTTWAKNGYGVDDTSVAVGGYTDGGIQLFQHYPGRTYPSGDYTSIYHIHDLCPAWFALTPNFNSDISDWQVDNTSDQAGYVSYLRDYTFAWAASFNQTIDWYFPPTDYVALGFINPDVRDLVEGDPGSSDTDWSLRDTYYSAPNVEKQGTGVNWNRNPLRKDMRSVYYSGITPVYKWQNTFTGSAWNNGGSSIPSIAATHMSSTFRDSDIDSALTIRKPIYGTGHYTRLFEGTIDWTGDKQIVWQMQNRIDDTDLANIFYHSIYADRMFKNSTYNGTMTEANWKWFWFNITNYLGFSHMKEGMDHLYSGWTSYAQRTTTITSGSQILVNDGFYATKNIYTNGMTGTGLYLMHDGSSKTVIRGGQYGTPNDNERPPPGQKNDFLGGSTFAPVSRQAWCGGHIPMDSVDPNHTFPYNPAETRNLREMFMGNTVFNQDLSDFRTRWHAIPGAAVGPNDANNWDTYFYPSGDYKPYNRSFGGVSYRDDNLNGHTYNNFGDQYPAEALGGNGNKFQKPDVSEMTYVRTYAYTNGQTLNYIHHPQNFATNATNLTNKNYYPAVIVFDALRWRLIGDFETDLDNITGTPDNNQLPTYGLCLPNYPHNAMYQPGGDY